MSRDDTPTAPIPPADHAVRVRCPHCGNRIQLVDMAPPREVVCGSCGSAFHLDPDATNSRTAEVLPKQIGRFVVLARLGRGAFGTVYKARDPDLARIVAVKVPRAGYFATATEEARFLREAKAAAKLQHPGIVTVHEVAEGDPPAIVSQFIDGVTLADRLTAGRPSFRESAELVAAVADALDHAHRHGVVHRDVKPSNVLLDEEGKPHLADFGLARRDEAEITVTIDGQILGTPAYMSPEQAAGKPADGRADVYSLGVMLYELLAGELPFRGNTRMLIHQVLNDDPKPPRKLNDHIPRDLETVCLKCLSKTPAKRYTAGELTADLRRWLDGKPVLARPVSGLERGWRWAMRNNAVAGLLTTAALLLVVALGVSLGFALFYRDATARTEGLLRQAERREGELAVENGIARADTGDRSGLLRMARGLELLQRSGATEEEQWFARMNLSLWGQHFSGVSVKTAGYSEYLSLGDGRTVLCLESGAKSLRQWVRRDAGNGAVVRRYTPPAFNDDGNRVSPAGEEAHNRAAVLDGGRAFAAFRWWNTPKTAEQGGGGQTTGWQAVVWDVETGAVRFQVSRTADRVPAKLFWGRTGRRACVLTEKPDRLELWDAAGGTRTADIPLDTAEKPSTRDSGFSADERLVWTSGPKGPVVRDAESGRVLWETDPSLANWPEYTFSPDGREFVIFEKGGEHPKWKLVVKRREAATGREIAPPAELPITDMRDRLFFSIDGRSLIAENQEVGWMRTFRSWEWPSLTDPARPDVHPDWVTPDRKFAIDRGGRLVSLTDAPGGGGSFGTGLTVCFFSADGRVVIGQHLGRGNLIRCRDFRTGRPIGPEYDADALDVDQERERRYRGHSGPGLVAPPTQTVLLLSLRRAANSTPTLSRLDLAPIEGTSERITLWAEVVTGMELDEAGNTRPLDEATLAERKRRLDELGGSPLPKP